MASSFYDLDLDLDLHLDLDLDLDFDLAGDLDPEVLRLCDLDLDFSCFLPLPDLDLRRFDLDPDRRDLDRRDLDLDRRRLSRDRLLDRLCRLLSPRLVSGLPYLASWILRSRPSYCRPLRASIASSASRWSKNRTKAKPLLSLVCRSLGM